jgi:anti-sigma factor RsiW
MIEVDCAEARDLLHLHVDGELGAEERAAMVGHIGRCERCRAELEAIEMLRARIKEAGPHAVPAGLESRIAAALDAEGRHPLAGAASPWRRYGAMAASHVLIAALSAGIVYGVLTSSRSDDRVVREVVNAHVRAGLTNQLVQVASSDTHTVKPWLAARLPFSPEVNDFAANGFPLIGGRVDYLLDRPVASLVYMHRQHAITMFVAPAEDELAVSGALAADRNGYHVASWRDGSSVYIATSDANLSDFNEFVALARAHRSR